MVASEQSERAEIVVLLRQNFFLHRPENQTIKIASEPKLLLFFGSETYNSPQYFVDKSHGLSAQYIFVFVTLVIWSCSWWFIPIKKNPEKLKLALPLNFLDWAAAGPLPTPPPPPPLPPTSDAYGFNYTWIISKVLRSWTNWLNFVLYWFIFYVSNTGYVRNKNWVRMELDDCIYWCIITTELEII